MTKRLFLSVFMVYASTGTALPVNILHSSSLVQQVKEGLNVTPPPLATLQDAWDSTYLLYFVTGDVAEQGSAFVVRNVRHGKTRTLDLVTAEHTLRPYCPDTRCGQYRVYTDGHIQMNTETGGTNFRTMALPKPQLRVLARDAESDLALVRITVDAEINPIPLTISPDVSREGSRVWAVGYPNIFLRTDTTNLDDPTHMVRRWSEGVTLGPVDVTGGRARLDPDAKLRQASTADSLPGNSGGALLNDQGHVIGVSVGSGVKPKRGYVYANRTSQGEFPVIAVSLAALREFLDDAYGSRGM